MHDIVIKTSFDYENFIKNNKLRLHLEFKPVLKSYIPYSALSICLIFVGFYEDRSGRFPFTTTVGFLIFYYMLIRWHNFYFQKKKFMKQVHELADRYQQESMDSINTFSEDYFEYEDKEKSYKFKWSLFKPFFIYKDNVILTIKHSGKSTFVFNKNQIGDEPFVQIVAFLNDKFKVTHNQKR